MSQTPRGFHELLKQTLVDTMFQRRTRRVSRGVKKVRAGSLTFESPDAEPRRLTPLEEAVLIAATGVTGITIPDRPFESDDGTDKIMGAPNLTMVGRSAGSPDNAQATHFFLINDSGTFFLRRMDADADLAFTPENLVRRAEACKQRVLSERLDFKAREFPNYLDSNRLLSNLPGTTILLPVVDLTRQYINALMYLLTQPDGHRPAFVDDRNFYRYAGVKRWVREGFLNKDVKVPLGVLGKMRTEYEALLLLQNLMLMAHGMGLGAWIHATIGPSPMLGHPLFADKNDHRGLGFEFFTPRFSLLNVLRWGALFPKMRSHPVGLQGCLEGLCPPYVTDMSAAVDKIIDHKFGVPHGIYQDPAKFEAVFKDGFAAKYVHEVPKYEQKVIDCAKDVCNYIYRTHGRFPAHCDAIDVPGVWLQVHYLNVEYYDFLFRDALTAAQRNHELWWTQTD